MRNVTIFVAFVFGSRSLSLAWCSVASQPFLSTPRSTGWSPACVQMHCAESTHLLPWIERVNEGLNTTNARFPFMAYGTDWLAFAHLVIAIAFMRPYIDPVRNKWVISFGLISCAAVVPLALIAGQIRGIPIGWRLIDCSFGVFGSAPLLLCRRSLFKLEQPTSETVQTHTAV